MESSSQPPSKKKKSQQPYSIYDDPETDLDQQSNDTSFSSYHYYDRCKKRVNHIYESVKSSSIWKKEPFRSIFLFLALLITCVVIVVVVLATASN